MSVKRWRCSVCERRSVSDRGVRARWCGSCARWCELVDEPTELIVDGVPVQEWTTFRDRVEALRRLPVGPIPVEEAPGLERLVAASQEEMS